MNTRLLVLSEKELLILKIMIEAQDLMYGLNLVDQSEGALKLGTVYVTLGRMEKKGYVLSFKESQRPNHKGLPRRLYRASPLGKRAYKLTTKLLESES